jgi:hypothetical protein
MFNRLGGSSKRWTGRTEIVKLHHRQRVRREEQKKRSIQYQSAHVKSSIGEIHSSRYDPWVELASLEEFRIMPWIHFDHPCPSSSSVVRIFLDVSTPAERFFLEP